MSRRKPRFKSFPDKGCEKCAGTGYKPTTWISKISGRTISGVEKCHCWTVIDLRKPKKSKRPVFDGKSAAMGADA